MGQGYSLLPQLGGKHHGAAKAGSINAIEMTMRLTRGNQETSEAEKSEHLKAPNAENDVTEVKKCATSTTAAEATQALPEAGQNRDDVTMTTCPKPKRPGLPEFAKEEEKKEEEEEREEEGDKRHPPEGAVSESEGNSEGKILGVVSGFNKTEISDKFFEIRCGIQDDSEAENDVSAVGDNTAKTATSGGRQKETRRNGNEADRSVCDQIATADCSAKSLTAPGRGSIAGNQPADTERSQNLPCRQIAPDRVRAGPHLPDTGPEMGSNQASAQLTFALEAKRRENLERVLIRELRGKFSGDKGEAARIKGEAAKIKGEAAKIKGEATKIKGEAAKIKGEAAKIKGDAKRYRSGVYRGADQARTTGNGSGSFGDGSGCRAGSSVETGSRNPRDEDDGKTKPEMRFQRLMTSSYSKRNKDEDDDEERHVGCHDDDDNNDNGCQVHRTTRTQRCNVQQRIDTSKGMTSLRLDDTCSSRTTPVVTDGTRQRAMIVREHCDGKLEIRRSSSFFLSADHRSRSKPVTMVQPRKIQGVRVLPQGFASCPKRPRNIQRVPAIRAPRRQAQQEATCPSHEFQRVGMRLRGTGRTSGRRQVLSNWGEGRQALLPRGSRRKQGKDRETDGGNWRTVVQVGRPSGTGGSGSLEGRSTAKESLLQAQKKEAEIAALLRHVQSEELEQERGAEEEEEGVSECLKNAPGTKRINFENALGYFP